MDGTALQAILDNAASQQVAVKASLPVQLKPVIFSSQVYKRYKDLLHLCKQDPAAPVAGGPTGITEACMMNNKAKEDSEESRDRTAVHLCMIVIINVDKMTGEVVGTLSFPRS